jgi:hypothetical protein
MWKQQVRKDAQREGRTWEETDNSWEERDRWRLACHAFHIKWKQRIMSDIRPCGLLRFCAISYVVFIPVGIVHT